MLTMERLEPALGTTLAFDPPGGEGFCEALEPLLTKISQPEQTAGQPARRLTDDPAARSRQRLQPGCQVRGLADHRLLLGGTLADQLADHDQAGGNADPGHERGVHRRLQSRQCIDDREPSADCPLGLVLMGVRPAEVGQPATSIVNPWFLALSQPAAALEFTKICSPWGRSVGPSLLRARIDLTFRSGS